MAKKTPPKIAEVRAVVKELLPKGHHLSIDVKHHSMMDTFEVHISRVVMFSTTNPPNGDFTGRLNYMKAGFTIPMEVLHEYDADEFAQWMAEELRQWLPEIATRKLNVRRRKEARCTG